MGAFLGISGHLGAFGGIWGLGLILIPLGISIIKKFKKTPVRIAAYCAHLSIAPFKNLLDHHAAAEWEGILKRSYHLKFKAL